MSSSSFHASGITSDAVSDDIVSRDITTSDVVGPKTSVADVVAAGGMSSSASRGKLNGTEVAVTVNAVTVNSVPTNSHSSELVPEVVLSDTSSLGTLCESAAAQSSSGFTASAYWSRIRFLLKSKVEDHLFRAYLDPLTCVGIERLSDGASRNALKVNAPSTLVRNHVEKAFGSLILESSQEVLGLPDLLIHYSVQPVGDALSLDRPIQGDVKQIVVKRVPVPQGPGSQASGTQNSSLALSSGPMLGASRSSANLNFASGLNPRYTFGNFVVGNNSQFCHAASLRVAEKPGASYNPLFIYGGVGLGKTHILHAIGNAVLMRNPSARVVYMSSESFTNDLILALRNAKMEEFKRRMRSIEVLLIDDIQFMCGKERTQEEFFHTFNTLYNAKHQIVITSDKIPQDIPGIEERLQTRFSWGLTADLQAPDFETRVAILKRKASLEGFDLPQDVAQYLAEKVSSNVRELEGALTRVHAVSSLQKVSLTIDSAASALKPILQPKTTSVSVDEIKRVVSTRFGIKVSEIVSKRRTKNLSFPRHIAMYLCRKHTTCSYPEIGDHFGNRDHSSVIHAATVVSTKLAHDQSLRDIVNSLERELFST